jgi:hypothetical protein
VEDVDVLITDAVEPGFRKELEQRGVEVLMA